MAVNSRLSNSNTMMTNTNKLQNQAVNLPKSESNYLRFKKSQSPNSSMNHKSQLKASQHEFRKSGVNLVGIENEKVSQRASTHKCIDSVSGNNSSCSNNHTLNSKHLKSIFFSKMTLCSFKKSAPNKTNSETRRSRDTKRVRSESESQYSPKTRNDRLTMKQNGIPISFMNRRRKNENIGYLRRCASAPESFPCAQRKPNSLNAIEIINNFNARTHDNESSRKNLMEQQDKEFKVDRISLLRTEKVQTQLFDAKGRSNRFSLQLQTNLSSIKIKIFGAKEVKLIPKPNESSSCLLSAANNPRRPNVLRRGETKLTRIAIGIVWLFLFCHIWRLVPTFYEAIHANHSNWPSWLMHIHDISHSLIVFNSAVNFLLYTLL